MATIKEITLGITESVQVGDYSYIKPSMSITATINPGESYDDAFQDVSDELTERMAKLVEKIRKERHE